MLQVAPAALRSAAGSRACSAISSRRCWLASCRCLPIASAGGGNADPQTRVSAWGFPAAATLTCAIHCDVMFARSRGSHYWSHPSGSARIREALDRRRPISRAITVAFVAGGRSGRSRRRRTDKRLSGSCRQDGNRRPVAWSRAGWRAVWAKEFCYADHQRALDAEVRQALRGPDCAFTGGQQFQGVAHFQVASWLPSPTIPLRADRKSGAWPTNQLCVALTGVKAPADTGHITGRVKVLDRREVVSTKKVSAGRARRNQLVGNDRSAGHGAVSREALSTTSLADFSRCRSSSSCRPGSFQRVIAQEALPDAI